jgi:2-oxoglutarate dehydrogenase E1 component
MTDQSPNDVFHASSFMQGHNAEYLEQLYARYAQTRTRSTRLARVLRASGDAPMMRKAEAQGPSWARTDWPPQPADD